jgi:aspartyl-tRNA synthetase
MDEDVHLMNSNDTDAMKGIRAKAYDIVINGYETAGGSIRIYQKTMQKRMFEILQISDEMAEVGFGHLLEAFKYGYPPTGGMAFGLDRVCMLLGGDSAIRDVIAFPKVKDASCPLTKSPSAVDKKQLDELGIALKSSP